MKWALTGIASATALLALLPAHAQTAAPEPQTAQGSGDIVVITGRRLSQADEAVGVDEATNTIAVTREALLSAPAGISGLKMLEQLPGFNVQTDGALGLYEFGNSVTVRAFNLQQIGFVLDGIPMGRSDAFGGSPIFRYVDNENLGAVIASPGAGDVSQPSYASLGPIVEYRSIDPSDEFSATVSQAFGDFNLNRSFVKLQTGDVGGFSAYVSRSKTDSDLWRGGGFIDREHLEGKIRYEWDSDTSLTFNFVSNDFFDYDSPSFTRATYLSTTPDNNGEVGRFRGYARTLPALPLGPLLDYPGQTGYTNTGFTDYFEDRINVREDRLYGLNFKTDVTDAIDVSATLYFEDKDGFGVSPDSYSNTRAIFLRQQQAGLAVTAPRGVQYGVSGVGGERQGVVLKGAFQIANHTLEAGVWLENDDYNRTQLRLNHAGGVQVGAVLRNEVAYFRRNYNSTRDTTQVFIKDTVGLLDDRLTLEFGVKSLMIDYELNGFRDFNDYSRTVGGVNVAGFGPQRVGKDYEDTFLPMVGGVYDLTGTEQVFASFSQNFALPRGADDIFSIASNPALGIEGPEGEMSDNFEVGVRTIRRSLSGALAVFYTTFENRLETFTNELPGQTGATETFSQNVGGVTSYGLELTGAWKPAVFNDYVYFNGNITYNNTTFDDDIAGFLAPATPGGPRRPLPISGNTLPDSPEWLVIGGVTFEPTEWLVANISAKYTAERFSNFINTEQVDAFTIVSAYVDVGGSNALGPFKDLKARVNVDNLFDEDVLAFISPSVNNLAFFRPQSPRTVSFSITADF
ncbi:TonB-dependent receptor [bacterium]|nr:TonB-dependent receptor [bacterium]